MRAFWERVNRFGVTDRIEIHDAQFSGDPIRLQSNEQGFEFRHSEVSQGADNLVNIHEIQIQTGRLDFWPKIQTAAERQLVSDILGADPKRFQIHWKRDSQIFWKGYIDPSITSYPETASWYFGRLRAADFDILRGIELPFTITTDSIIKNLAFLLGFLDFNLPIQTATSWITLNTDNSKDFLQQIYCNRENLRSFARVGGEQDRRITIYESLEKMCDPLLLIKQIGGRFLVEQLTAFEDPTQVYQTLYDKDGNVITDTAKVDRTAAAYTKFEDGLPVVKHSSGNDSYPGLKQVRVRFEHRTTIAGLKFPPSIEIEQSGSYLSDQMLFISTGDQWLRLTGDVRADMREGATQSSIALQIRVLRDGAPDYYWNGSTWTTGGSVTIPLGASGGDIFRGSIKIETTRLPADADGLLQVLLTNATGDTTPSTALLTAYMNMEIVVLNPSIEEGNNVSIDYMVTQDQDFPTIYQYRDTWYGDGPTAYALSAYRVADGTPTADVWERRGGTDYRSFHYNLIKDLLDIQRTRTRKINANLYGEYDPTKILIYNGKPYYYAGGSYDGRWHPVLMQINIQNG